MRVFEVSLPWHRFKFLLPMMATYSLTGKPDYEERFTNSFLLAPERSYKLLNLI